MTVRDVMKRNLTLSGSYGAYEPQGKSLGKTVGTTLKMNEDGTRAMEKTGGFLGAVAKPLTVLAYTGPIGVAGYELGDYVYDKWFLEKTPAKFLYTETRNGPIPTFLTNYPTFVEEKWVRRNVTWPWWIYSNSRDIGVINSVWHGDMNKTWGLKTALVDVYVGNQRYTSSGDRWSFGNEVYGLGIPNAPNTTANQIPKALVRSDGLEVTTFYDAASTPVRQPWIRTLIKVTMPPKPSDADEIIGAYIYIDPMRVGSGHTTISHNNFLCLNDYSDVGLEIDEATWMEPRAGVLWENKPGKKPGAYINVTAAEWENEGAQHFSAIHPYDGVDYGLSSNRTWHIWNREYDGANDNPTYPSYTDKRYGFPERKPHGLGPILFPIKDDNSTSSEWSDWGQTKTFLLHWRKEGDGGEGRTADVQEGTDYDLGWTLSMISTLTAEDRSRFMQWSLVSDNATRKSTELGGPLYWLSFPSLRHFHLVVVYKKTPPENIEGNNPGKISIVTENLYDRGGIRNTIDNVYRGQNIIAPTEVFTTIDYLRNSPDEYQRMTDTGHLLHTTISYGGRRTSWRPRFSFNDEWLRQTPNTTEFYGSDEGPWSYGSPSVYSRFEKPYPPATNKYPGSRIGAVRLSNLPAPTSDIVISIKGGWASPTDGVVYNGTGTITITSTNYNDFAILAVGPSSRHYCYRIDEVSISSPLNGLVAICAIGLMNVSGNGSNATTPASVGTYPDENVLVSASMMTSDYNFFNVRAGEPVFVGSYVLGNASFDYNNYVFARVWGCTDFMCGITPVLQTNADNNMCNFGPYYMHFVCADPNDFDPTAFPTSTSITPSTGIISFMGDGLIYVLPVGTSGQVMKRTSGTPTGSLTKTLGPDAKINTTSGYYPSLELVSAFADETTHIVDEVFSPVNTTYAEAASHKFLELDMETELPKTGANTIVAPGKEFYMKFVVAENEKVPDEIRIEWCSGCFSPDTKLELMETITLLPTYVEGRDFYVGPISLSSHVGTPGDVGYTPLNIYFGMANGPDTLYQITTFGVSKASTGDATVELAVHPLQSIAKVGNSITSRITRASCPNQNYHRMVGDASIQCTEYTSQLYVWNGTAYILRNNQTKTDTEPVFSIPLAVDMGDMDDNGLHPPYVEAWAVFYLKRDSLTTEFDTITTPKERIYITITKDVSDLVDSTSGYKHLGVPDIGSPIISFDFGIEREITSVMAEDGSVTFTDAGKTPVSVSVSGVAKGATMADDISYLNNIVDTGLRVFWDVEEHDCVNGVPVKLMKRYYGKAKSIQYSISRPNDVAWTMTVEGVQKTNAPV